MLCNKRLQKSQWHPVMNIGWSHVWELDGVLCVSWGRFFLIWCGWVCDLGCRGRGTLLHAAELWVHHVPAAHPPWTCRLAGTGPPHCGGRCKCVSRAMWCLLKPMLVADTCWLPFTYHWPEQVTQQSTNPEVMKFIPSTVGLSQGCACGEGWRNEANKSTYPGHDENYSKSW